MPAEANALPFRLSSTVPALGTSFRDRWRARDVVDVVAGSERHQIRRALADPLDDEHNRSSCKSLSAIVSGMRSAPGPSRTVTNWPGWRTVATRGALTTSLCTSGDSFVLDITW
jgi:hypothetical protein